MGKLNLVLTPVIILLAAIFAGYINITSFTRGPKVLGLFRQQNRTLLTAAHDFVTIPDTTFCEDLHYHERSGLLFTACELSESVRYSWFPPLGNFDDPSAALSSQGRIQVIDPATFKSQRLDFQGFNGPFVTHGIDVIDDPERPDGEAVYIFAVNHVPNSRHLDLHDKQAQKSRSVIEVFHHVIGSKVAQHIRTVWHELITTPNDVVALSPTSLLVTNDHYYTEGHMRAVEDLYYGAKWSNTVHVTFSGAGKTTHDADGVQASIALDSLHNNNGIGRGNRPDQIVIVTAASGTVNFGNLVTSDGRVQIHINSTFEAESALDNPSYFADPYANSTFDASGYTQCGLARAGDLLKNIRDPDGKDGVMVWHVSNTSQHRHRSAKDEQASWGARLLFEDDSSRIRTGSAAVLVAIDPAKEMGSRKAWLYMTGFLSKNMVAAKIDL